VGSPIDLDVLEFGAAAYQVYARKDQRVAVAVSREQRSVAQEDGERVGSRVSKEVARAGSRSQAGGGPRGERSERERDPGGGGSGSASLPSSRDGSSQSPN
jgi:single-stranded DNA-binding protein